MTTQIKDLMYFEEKHTQYARNSKTFDNCYTGKHVYVVNELDDEYGRLTFRGVAYTFDTACLVASEKFVEQDDYFGSRDYLYENWLLVGDEDTQDFWSWIFSTENSGYTCTQFYIFAYDADGKVIDSVQLFVNKTYIGEQQ